MKSGQYKFTTALGAESTYNIFILRFGKVKYIGFEDIGMGPSVTNTSEDLASHLVQTHDWDPNDCLFFEWYDGMDDNGVDEIEYTWTDKTARDPKWKPFCSAKDNPFK